MALALAAGEVHVWSTPEEDPLRGVLARYLDLEPGEIELRRDRRGKPRLAGRSPRLRFNLSHSGGLSLVAVAADREVGVDVEAIEPGRDFERLARRWLGREAAARVVESPPAGRAAAFYAAWTRHEAVAKCLGTGLAGPLPAAPPVAVHTLDAGEGHAAALAVAGATTPVGLCSSPPIGDDQSQPSSRYADAALAQPAPAARFVVA